MRVLVFSVPPATCADAFMHSIPKLAKRPAALSFVPTREEKLWTGRVSKRPLIMGNSPFFCASPLTSTSRPVLAKEYAQGMGMLCAATVERYLPDHGQALLDSQQYRSLRLRTQTAQ